MKINIRFQVKGWIGVNTLQFVLGNDLAILIYHNILLACEQTKSDVQLNTNETLT